MCVLSIKVPIRKKSGNLFNDHRTNKISVNKWLFHNIIIVAHWLKQKVLTKQKLLLLFVYQQRPIHKLSWEIKRETFPSTCCKQVSNDGITVRREGCKIKIEPMFFKNACLKSIQSFCLFLSTALMSFFRIIVFDKSHKQFPVWNK